MTANDVGLLEWLTGMDIAFLLFVAGVLVGAVGAFAMITWSLVQESKRERETKG